MMLNENRILEIVNSHKNSIIEAMGDTAKSQYMQGYLNACTNISDILYTYLKASQFDNTEEGR